MQSHEYEARLGQLGAYQLLDTYQLIQEDALDHLIQAHQFHRLWLGGDTLRLATLDVNWLSTMIDSNKITLPYVRREKEIILTASTKELQAFVVLYADDPTAFKMTGMYIRER